MNPRGDRCMAALGMPFNGKGRRTLDLEKGIIPFSGIRHDGPGKGVEIGEVLSWAWFVFPHRPDFVKIIRFSNRKNDSINASRRTKRLLQRAGGYGRIVCSR